MPWLLSTGDDDGIIKVRQISRHLRKSAADAFVQLWDPRRRDCIRTYTQHSDYITDFLWLDDKKQLVATRCVI
jgi:WD40 repeat protein